MRRCSVLAVLLAIAVLFTCCKDSTGPATGTLRVTVSTTGTDLDSDGYTCSVDGSSRSVAVNETVTWNGVEVGDHAVELTGLAGNCVVSGENPRNVTVTLGETATVTFDVSCSALTGALQVITVTTGDTLDWDGYVLILNDTHSTHIEINDTLTFTDIPKGEYRIGLDDVAVNCAMGGDNPRSVLVTSGDTTEVSFDAVCAPAFFDYLVYAYSGGRSPPRIPHIELASVDGTNRFSLSRDYEPSSDSGLFPDFSPDGTRFAIASNHGGNYDIYVTNLAGQDLVRLTNDTAVDRSPDWSPDGSRIAFTSDRHGKNDIFIMDSDGTNLTRLTTDPARDWNPTWSPDGSRIAFVSDRDDNWEIYVMDADGSGALRLTDNPASDACPSWSPDGSQIVYESERSDNQDIYIMNADGSHVVRLTDGPYWDGSPSWSPDGARIAMNSYSFEGGGIGGGLYIIDSDGTNVVLIRSIGYGGTSTASWSPMSSIHR